jgi:hypothetical protein
MQSSMDVVDFCHDSDDPALRRTAIVDRVQIDQKLYKIPKPTPMFYQFKSHNAYIRGYRDCQRTAFPKIIQDGGRKDGLNRPFHSVHRWYMAKKGRLTSILFSERGYD